MNRSWILSLVIVFTALTTGCGGMKETFHYQTARAGAGGESESARSCKTPLRVAVTSFADEREHAMNTDAAALATGAGMVLAPPSGLEVSHPSKHLPLYVHDDRRLFALALYSELAASGCFTEVALDPLDESQYDLLFTGTIRRFARLQKRPFVPIPLYVGTLISVLTTEQHDLLEVDLFARRPGEKKPVLSYGLAGSCSDCSQDNVSDSLARSLQAGNADFIARLRGYLGRRSPAFWREYQARRDRQRRLKLDPELDRLASAARAQPEPARTRLATSLEDKKARLNQLIRSERETELRWARTSIARARAELAATNQLADDTFSRRMRAAVIGGLLAAGTAGATGTTTNIQVDTRRGFDLAMSMSRKPEVLAKLDPKTRRAIERVLAERKAAASVRKRALAEYRRETGSVSDLLANTEGDETRVSAPQAARMP